MTLEEKFYKLSKYCGERTCDDCPIFKAKGYTGSACFSLSSPETVNESYKLAFGSDHEPDDEKITEETEDNCGNCKHTDKTEEDYPCIACKRNYSFSDKMHWKYPDRWEAAKDEKQKENENTPSIEEMNAVIQKHCMNTNDCAECPLKKICVSIDGIYSDHPVECAIAYKYLQGFAAPHTDAVNHPAHYQGKYECIDEMIALFGRHAVMDFCRCNVYKYRYRAAAKGGQEDLDKANWYMDKLIELQGKGNA